MSHPSDPTREGLAALRVIYEAIGERTNAIAHASPDWPCRRGCDDCCRNLARAPELAAAEWEYLWPAYLQLDARTRARVRADVNRLHATSNSDAQHVSCPLLDQKSGLCRVYERRPAACRMYGFYVARDGGQYCSVIHERERAGLTHDVVWGNHDALESALRRALGPPIPMWEWFQRHPED